MKNKTKLNNQLELETKNKNQVSKKKLVICLIVIFGFCFFSGLLIGLTVGLCL